MQVQGLSIPIKWSIYVLQDDLYGGTTSLFRNIISKNSNISFTFMPLNDIAALEAAITEKTKLIWLESPTNPLLRSTDIRAVAAVAKKHGIYVGQLFCFYYNSSETMQQVCNSDATFMPAHLFVHYIVFV